MVFILSRHQGMHALVTCKWRLSFSDNHENAAKLSLILCLHLKEVTRLLTGLLVQINTPVRHTGKFILLHNVK